MSQLQASDGPHKPIPNGAIPKRVSLFPSDLGWFGLVGRAGRLSSLTFGHRTPHEVHERLRADGSISPQDLAHPIDWCPDLKRRLQAYASGEPDDFADVLVNAKRTTSFQNNVVQAVRAVRYGETVSYGELAERAGAPRAARAVGRVMATNPLPIIIPCHRVVGSGGRLGGYSAPSGLTMKRTLLQLEAAQTCIATGSSYWMS